MQEGTTQLVLSMFWKKIINFFGEKNNLNFKLLKKNLSISFLGIEESLRKLLGKSRIR